MAEQEQIQPSVESEALFRDDYHDKFSPIGYLKRYWSLTETWTDFPIDNTFRLLRHESISGSRLLDLGCGPNLLTVIGAPDHFTHIVMADYAHVNLDIIRRSQRGEDVGYDWGRVCMFFSERHGLGKSWETSRLSNLRSSIQDVVHCDVLKPQPLGPAYTGFFDCVFSSYCLEAAARDVDSYNQAWKNSVSLLKPGGHFLMRSCLGEKSYPVNGKDFFTLPINDTGLRTAITESGLTIKELIIEGLDCEHQKSDGIHGYCLLAEKNPQ